MRLVPKEPFSNFQSNYPILGLGAAGRHGLHFHCLEFMQICLKGLRKEYVEARRSVKFMTHLAYISALISLLEILDNEGPVGIFRSVKQ